jgi:hypothetical protein
LKKALTDRTHIDGPARYIRINAVKPINKFASPSLSGVSYLLLVIGSKTSLWFLLCKTTALRKNGSQELISEEFESMQYQNTKIQELLR